MLRDFISLIYPHLCAACSKPLYNNENHICTYCRYQLPKTNFHLEKDNPISRIFWGRVNIHAATSCYYFNKGGKIQRLIHQLKYMGGKEIGITIGRFLGADLKESSLFSDIEYIVPVPLHRSKRRKRGYNQSDYFAKGLSESMEATNINDNLYRASKGASQTRKAHYERWENVESSFKVKRPDQLKEKHILLVDDVVTTGATLESCAHALLDIPDTTVSIATIACA